MSPMTREWLLFVLLAAVYPLLEALATYDPAKVTDYRAWGIGLGAAMVRAAAAAIIAKLGTKALPRG